MKATHWHKNILFLAISLLYGCVLLSASKPTFAEYYKDPKSIIRKVSERGAQIVVAELYSKDEMWSFVLRNIATGAEAWLNVAITLHHGSDAGASEMVTLSIGEALESLPENVFRIALKEFPLKSICSGPDVDDKRFDSYELSMAAINRRERRISAISNSNLKEVGKECINYLEEAKVGIKKFYGIQ